MNSPIRSVIIALLLTLAVLHGEFSWANDIAESARATLQIKALERQILSPSDNANGTAQLIRVLQDALTDRKLTYFAIETAGRLKLKEAEPALSALNLEWGAMFDPRKEMPDGLGGLYSATCLALWQIHISSLADADSQEQELLTVLNSKGGEVPVAGLPRVLGRVDLWAAEELANRGAARALDAMRRMAHKRWGVGHPQRYQEFVGLCEKKIELLSQAPDRFIALAGALTVTNDGFDGYPLKSWAVEELGALKSEEARQALVSYGLALQRASENGFEAEAEDKDEARFEASYVYPKIIEMLQMYYGMSGAQVRTTGLRPDAYFMMAHPLYQVIE